MTTISFRSGSYNLCPRDSGAQNKPNAEGPPLVDQSRQPKANANIQPESSQFGAVSDQNGAKSAHFTTQIERNKANR